MLFKKTQHPDLDGACDVTQYEDTASPHAPACWAWLGPSPPWIQVPLLESRTVTIVCGFFSPELFFLFVSLQLHT